MTYLYHLVPENMQGDILYPLTMLRERFPDVYAEHMKPYEGREGVTRLHIPFLNCLWNDVIHLSPIHPSLRKQALIEAGSNRKLDFEYFEIDPHVLDPKNATVFLYTKEHLALDLEDFRPFDPDTLDLYSILPQTAKDYYQETISQKHTPFMNHLLPHIFYKGAINVSKVKRVRI